MDKKPERKIIQIIPVSGYESVWKDREGEWVEPVYVFALVEDKDPVLGKFRHVEPLGVSDEPGGWLDFLDDFSSYKGVRLIKR